VLISGAMVVVVLVSGAMVVVVFASGAMMSSPRRLCLLTRTSIVSGNSSTSHRPAGCRAPWRPTRPGPLRDPAEATGGSPRAPQAV